MTIQSDMALMAAGSYWDVRVANEFNINLSNRAPTPAGWRVLTAYDVSDSGPNANTGFSGRVYENIATGGIVISFGGTEFDTSSYGLAADFLSGNVPLALGTASAQALAAAKLYQRVKADPNLSDSISFTGHSLGGGIASVLAGTGATRLHKQTLAIDLVASYGRKQCIGGTFDCKNRDKKTTKQLTRCCSRRSDNKNTRALSARECPEAGA